MAAATVRLPRRDEPLPGLPSLREYNIFRAIEACAEGRQLAGLEGEVHQELERLSGRSSGHFATGRSAYGSSFFMPLTAPIGEVQKRDLTTSTGAGSLTNPTDSRPARFIDVLRAKSLVLSFGAQPFNDMTGQEFILPRKTAGATVAWISEGNAASESNPTIDRVIFEPHTVSGWCDISRHLIKTSSDAQGLVIRDLSGSLATEFDRVSLAGNGSGNEPEGLVHDSSIPTVALGTDGAALTYADIVGIEETLADANADAATGRLGWITTPAVRRKLRLTEKIADTGQFVWPDDSRLLGHPADATNHMPSDFEKGSGENLSTLLYGDWSALCLGSWGGVDVLVDPVTLGASGGVRVVLFLTLDVKALRPESFVKVLDIVTE